MRKKYGIWNFLGDCLGILVLNIFWIVWIFIREMRGLRK